MSLDFLQNWGGENAKGGLRGDRSYPLAYPKKAARFERIPPLNQSNKGFEKVKFRELNQRLSLPPKSAKIFKRRNFRRHDHKTFLRFFIFVFAFLKQFSIV